ncbi:MAG: TPM domain-containing protein [Ramlibacter sp.]|nr:TPM domain-containing protein [Ramlibacter sp.]
MVVTLAILVSIAWERHPAVPLPPAPAHYLDDRAGLVSAGFAAAKNQYLEYLSQTARIAHVNIVILPRAPAPDLEAFVVRAATAWKIGAGGVDNGLALFIFREERALRLEVGYGLESSITDAQASRLLAETVVPAFARGAFEAGIEDFLSAVNKTLESSEAANRRAAHSVGLIEFAGNVLRHAPGAGRKVWQAFLEADRAGRFLISLSAMVLGVLALYAAAIVARAVPAVALLPWRLYTSPTLRGATAAGVARQFSPRSFLQRPPPFVLSVFNELRMGAIANAAYALAALVVGAALLFAGAGLFMDGLGKFGGAGATVSWPAA